TKVQVDKVRSHPVDDLFCRLSEGCRVGAEELNPDRPLNFIEVEIFAGPLIQPENSFCRNYFRCQNIRTVFFTELPENLVRDACHWREKKRKLILKPRERHNSE